MSSFRYLISPRTYGVARISVDLLLETGYSLVGLAVSVTLPEVGVSIA